MSRNRSARKAKAFEDIENLKASRRKDILKCVGAFATIAVLVTGKLFLETSGIIEIGNIAMGAVMMFSAIGLAILGGTASVDFTKCGRQIQDICSRNGISKQDIADFKQEARQA